MMLSKEHIKECVFEYIDECEFFEIYKEKVKLEDLIEIYQGAYKSGYFKAISDLEDASTNLYWKARGEEE
jgi:hypothetical protein